MSKSNQLMFWTPLREHLNPHQCEQDIFKIMHVFGGTIKKESVESYVSPLV
jgi:hypothetical protein